MFEPRCLTGRRSQLLAGEQLRITTRGIQRTALRGTRPQNPSDDVGTPHPAMGSASDRPFQAKRKRCRRDNQPGHAHTLTFWCFHRQPFLTRERSRHWTLEA